MVPYLRIPVTPGAFQQTNDYRSELGGCGGFVAKLNATGSAFEYATYLGSLRSSVEGLAIDANGNAWVAGWTDEKSFPVTADALKPSIGIGTDAYVVKLNQSGSTMLYGTFIGDGGVGNSTGTTDSARRVFLNPNGDIFVTGNTTSADFPLVNPPNLPDVLANSFLFVARLADGVASPRPSVSTTGVVNAASLLPAAVADGEIITIFGSNLGSQTPAQLQTTPSGRVGTSAGASRVIVNGDPIPILFANNNQINAVLPTLGDKSAVRIQVEYQGRKSDVLTVPTAATPAGDPFLHSSPGVFTTSGTGVGQAAVLNQDGAPNSRSMPAARGSTISLYGTGAGAWDTNLPSGTVVSSPLPKPRLPVSVTIGGVDGRVTYAGAAPGLVLGVLQVNIVIPLGSPVGEVPLVMTAGPSKSQAGVTIAVR
jgi:uncharacterized protein (TIGR03437 family)